MKRLRNFSLRTFASLSLSAFVLNAQTPAGDDPFVKGAPTSDASATAKAPASATLLVVHELYLLPREKAFALLNAERSSAGRYRRVTELRKDGSARLESLNAVTTKSGQRCELKSTDEFRCPNQFDFTPDDDGKPDDQPKDEKAGPPAGIGQPPREKSGVLSAAAFEAGDTLELEPVIAADGRTLDVNIVIQRAGFQGFRDFTGPAGIPLTMQPIFASEKLTTSRSMTIGEPAFLGTLSSAPTDERNGDLRLAFLRVLKLPESVAPANTPKLPNLPLLHFEYSLYSLARGDALELLADWPVPESPWTKLQALLQGKKARCEQMTSLVSKSGQRVITEELRQWPYASSYRGVGANGRGGGVSAHEVRNLGVTIELEPVLSSDGRTVDLNHIPQLITYRGEMKYSSAAQHLPAMPIFELRKLTSSGTFHLGQPMLVGTLNPPFVNGVNGRTDEQRVWLLFVRTQFDLP